MNTSVFSLAMSDEQIAGGIGAGLARGMTGKEVKTQLDAWRLDWRVERRFWQYPESDSELSAGGIVAQVEPYGVYCTFMRPPHNGQLWLYFERGSGGLHAVRWLRPLPKGWGLQESVDVPLAAGERIAS